MTTKAATRYATTTTPIGPMLLVAEDGALVGLYLDEDATSPRIRPDWREGGETVEEAQRQIEEYFAGTRTTFELEVHPRGTAFQQQVWAALWQIPYGTTVSYGDIARSVGRPRASRAVGSANGRNPVSIVIPCHRVIASDGGLGGYGWGLDRKTWLLDHEHAHDSARSGERGRRG